MKAMRWMAVPVLALGGVACGSDSGGSGSSESGAIWRRTSSRSSTASDAAFTGRSGVDRGDVRRAEEDLADAVDAAPDEIKDEVEATAKAIEQFDQAFKDADYNLLDVDQSALQDLGKDMDGVSDKIEAYNLKECGIEPDSTGSGSSDTSASEDTSASDDTTAAGSVGTARDQMMASLTQLGFTEDEAKCVADNIDPETAAGVVDDPSLMMEIFTKCDIGLDRLSKIGDPDHGRLRPP